MDRKTLKRWRYVDWRRRGRWVYFLRCTANTQPEALHQAEREFNMRLEVAQAHKKR